MRNHLKLMLVAGARPNFMKIAPVIREIHSRRDQFQHVLVHTGQHYDEGMSDVFFRDLGIPKPDYHLNVGSGTHAEQTARIMIEFEPIVASERPDCVVVFGDVNSTLACSIVSKKLGFPVAHVEAGLRSGDRSMPEEINRIVTDSISDYFFVTEESGLEHLRQEGKDEADVFYVGHVMIDNLFFEIRKLDNDDVSTSGCVNELIPLESSFGVVTLHRPSNVDDECVLRGIIEALGEIAVDLPLVFPVHPRTKSRMEQFQITLPPGIIELEPLGYRDFLSIWRRAVLVLTDSGGLQEETTALGIPCFTLRDNTERPVTVTEGTNVLVGVDPQRIIHAARAALGKTRRKFDHTAPKLWDGRASGRILDALRESLEGS